MAQPTGSLNAALYCRACLHGRGELIYYASCQNSCAVCGSALVPVDFAEASREIPSINEVMEDPSASFWLRQALRGALARDPVDAANDAEMLTRLLDARCCETLHSWSR